MIAIPNQPIGRVVYPGGSVVAELRAEDEWFVWINRKRNAALERTLTALYSRTYTGPDQGYYGQFILNDLAKRTGGTMTIRDFPRENPDLVY